MCADFCDGQPHRSGPCLVAFVAWPKSQACPGPARHLRAGGMEAAPVTGSHGSCQKVTALLVFDPMTGVATRQALQRWTGVSVTSDEHQKEELVPPKPRYSRDVVVDARISADVASLPRMPLPARGERSTRHRAHTGRAIRNVPLRKPVTPPVSSDGTSASPVGHP